MPWVNEEMCVGCGLCVEECPVDAISLQGNDTAAINDDECIRCGKCHDVCPQEAVRHDSERIPIEVLLERMVRYFAKEKKVAELSIEQVKKFMAEVE